MNATHNVDAGALRSLARRVLVAAGTPQHVADVVTDVLVEANLTGHESHGVLRIPAYLEEIASGRIQPAAEPQILGETDTVIRLDGRNGFGHHAAHTGMNLAIRKARRANLCAVGFTNIGHIGRLGHYAEQAARAGCIGLITYGTGGDEGPTVPFGGKAGRLGTNPLAAGIPTGDAAPFVLDFATSVVAEGKLQVARSRNQDLPEGYVVDKDGHPSRKTADFYDGGHLLPFGGHKGYGLSLLICLLGGLCGAFDPAKHGLGGTFMQVIDVDAFTPLGPYQSQARALLDLMKATPPAEGFDRVMVPGDFEHERRTRCLAEGIDLPDAIYQQLRQSASKLAVSFAL